MALQLNFTFEQQCNCTDVLFNDTTGDYSFPGNQGGYGVQTVESIQINYATLAIKKTTWDNPIYLNYTIAFNVIADATLTDQFGVTTNVYNKLSNLAFPFVNQILDTSILLGTATSEDFEPGAYFVTYTVRDSINVYSYEKWFFFVCKYNSCVEEVGIKLAKRQITPEKAQEVFLTYDLIFLNVGLQKVTEVEEQIEAMDLLCGQCGCCH